MSTVDSWRCQPKHAAAVDVANESGIKTCRRHCANRVTGAREQQAVRRPTYFHLRLACMEKYYRRATVDDIYVKQETLPQLTPGHIDVLLKFGVRLPQELLGEEELLQLDDDENGT